MGDLWDERKGRVEGNRCGRAARFGGKMNELFWLVLFC